MGKMFGEPVLVLVTGGTVLIQALLQLGLAFGLRVTAEQQAAIMVVAGIVLPLIARTQVTPMSTLPPGVAGKIADANAAQSAAKDKDTL